MRVRHRRDPEHDPVGDLPPAEGAQTGEAGAQPPGGQADLLFPGGRPCAHDHRPGHGPRQRMNGMRGGEDHEEEL